MSLVKGFTTTVHLFVFENFSFYVRRSTVAFVQKAQSISFVSAKIAVYCNILKQYLNIMGFSQLHKSNYMNWMKYINN
jgi:hypothetical protein